MQKPNISVNDGELPCETEIRVEKSNSSAALQVHEEIPFGPHVSDLSDCEWVK